MCGIHEPECFKMKFAAPLGLQDQEMLLPHALFADIYHKYPRTWRMTIRGESGKLDEFWAVQSLHHPLLQDEEHPLKMRDSSKCVPLSIHGDEVPISGLGKTWVKKMCNFSWSSLLRSGNTKDSSYWIWGLLEKVGVSAEGDEAANLHRSQKNRTLQRFFLLLQWSLYWLWMGQWPDRDVDGKLNLGFLAITLFSFGGWVNSITLSRSMGDFGVRTIEKDISSVHPMWPVYYQNSSFSRNALIL